MCAFEIDLLFFSFLSASKRGPRGSLDLLLPGVVRHFEGLGILVRKFDFTRDF